MSRGARRTGSPGWAWPSPRGQGDLRQPDGGEHLTLFSHPGPTAGRRRNRQGLRRVPHLKDSRHKRGGNLSGGQQRLLSLAAVLLVPPKLLVADELSLGLAPVVIDAVYDGLRQIHEAGTALLIVEQQIDRVLDLADEAIVLDCGTLAYDGPADGAGEAMDGLLASRWANTMSSPTTCPAANTGTLVARSASPPLRSFLA